MNANHKPQETLLPTYIEMFEGMPYTQIGNSTVVFEFIERRFRDIENKVNKKNKREKASRAQKFLMLHHLGMLEPLLSENLSTNHKAKLLSVILNEDYDNLHQDITDLLKRESKLKSPINYEFLTETFGKNGLPKLSEEMDEERDKIVRNLEAAKDKKKPI